ncbi:MAG: response regulator [Bacteroidota bacterium]|nr:response regulator [Bacteroidota bacterium]
MKTNDKYNILYVDDEADNLVVFKSAFKKYYHIFTANSASEGIEVLKENEIAVIITDQRMPEMTGIQFLKGIPEVPENIRMILTGFSDMQAIIEAINSGYVYKYVSKPWDKNELKAIIDEAISAFEKRNELRAYIQELKERNEELEHKVTELIKKVEG